MKASYYNYFYPEDDTVIAYNSFRNSLVQMTSEDYNEYLKAIDSNSHNNTISPVVGEMKRCGFIIEDPVDELKIIRHRMYKSRYETKILGLTIAPTTCCNFRCAYCYEDKIHRDNVMDDSTQNAIIDYVKKCADTIKYMHVSWYGGEPLLALDIIEKLSDAFISVCSEKNIQYSASIVTNGYLLNRKAAQTLIDKKISNCQITIDGDENSHDQRRPHYSGKGTYKTIIQNIINIDGIIPNIAIRVNTDKNNADGVNKIMDIIKSNNLHSCFPYAAHIRDYSGDYCVGECFSQKEFMAYEYSNLTRIGNPDMIMTKYPVIRNNVCGADTMGGFIINADGKLYKCWSDIGIDNLSYGNIKDGITNEMNAIMYITDDPTRDPKCSKCKLLPVCMGGCPRQRRLGDEEKCIYYEDLNQLYMKKIAQIINNKE